MGAGASLPTSIDKATAQSLAGEKFDEAAFDDAAKDGAVSKEEFIAAAKARGVSVTTQLAFAAPTGGTIGENLRFTFETKHGDDATPYHLQGDEDLHRTLPSAQRAALRHDARVVKELDKFFRVFRKETISKPEYLLVHSKFAAVLIPDLSPDEVHDSGEEDWLADAGGAERMNKQQFQDCLFELADLYTTGIDGGAYATWLRRLFRRITASVTYTRDGQMVTRPPAPPSKARREEYAAFRRDHGLPAHPSEERQAPDCVANGGAAPDGVAGNEDDEEDDDEDEEDEEEAAALDAEEADIEAAALGNEPPANNLAAEAVDAADPESGSAGGEGGGMGGGDGGGGEGDGGGAEGDGGVGEGGGGDGGGGTGGGGRGDGVGGGESSGDGVGGVDGSDGGGMAEETAPTAPAHPAHSALADPEHPVDHHMLHTHFDPTPPSIIAAETLPAEEEIEYTWAADEDVFPMVLYGDGPIAPPDDAEGDDSIMPDDAVPPMLGRVASVGMNRQRSFASSSPLKRSRVGGGSSKVGGTRGGLGAAGGTGGMPTMPLAGKISPAAAAAAETAAEASSAAAAAALEAAAKLAAGRKPDMGAMAAVAGAAAVAAAPKATDAGETAAAEATAAAGKAAEAVSEALGPDGCDPSGLAAAAIAAGEAAAAALRVEALAMGGGDVAPQEPGGASVGEAAKHGAAAAVKEAAQAALRVITRTRAPAPGAPGVPDAEETSPPPVDEAIVAAMQETVAAAMAAATAAGGGDSPGATAQAEKARGWATRVKQLEAAGEAVEALTQLGKDAKGVDEVAHALLEQLDNIQAVHMPPLPTTSPTEVPPTGADAAASSPAEVPPADVAAAAPLVAPMGAVFIRSDTKPGHLQLAAATDAAAVHARPSPKAATAKGAKSTIHPTTEAPLAVAAFDVLRRADECCRGTQPRNALDGAPISSIAEVDLVKDGGGGGGDTGGGGGGGGGGAAGDGGASDGNAISALDGTAAWPLWSASGLPFGVLTSNAPPELLAPLADAAAGAIEATWRRGLLGGVLDGLSEWVTILAEGSDPPVSASVVHVPTQEGATIDGEVYRLPLSDAHGSVAITLQPKGGGGAPPALSEHMRRGLESTVPLIRPMLRELELLVIGQPVALAESFGVDGSGISLSVASTLPKERQQEVAAEVHDEADDEDSPADAPPDAQATTGVPDSAGAGGADAGRAGRGATGQIESRRLVPARAKAPVAVAAPSRYAHRRPRPLHRGGTVFRPFRPWRRKHTTGHGQRVSVYAAVRLLLPRKLQAQVGKSLDAMALKAALAELKSYRDPPKVVVQVVAAVLCLLGLARLPGGRLPPWAQLRGHLKSSLPRNMMQFDAAKAAAEDAAPWKESASAAEGLTSDDVWKKGSLAVQTMLRWLEVTRLTRKNAALAQTSAVADGEVGE